MGQYIMMKYILSFLLMLMITVSVYSQEEQLTDIYKYYNLDPKSNIVIMLNNSQCYDCNVGKIPAILKSIYQYFPKTSVAISFEQEPKMSFGLYRSRVPQNVPLFVDSVNHFIKKFNTSAAFIVFDENFNRLRLYKFLDIGDIKLFVRYLAYNNAIKVSLQKEERKSNFDFANTMFLSIYSNDFMALNRITGQVIIFDKNFKEKKSYKLEKAETDQVNKFVKINTSYKISTEIANSTVDENNILTVFYNVYEESGKNENSVKNHGYLKVQYNNSKISKIDYLDIPEFSCVYNNNNKFYFMPQKNNSVQAEAAMLSIPNNDVNANSFITKITLDNIMGTTGVFNCCDKLIMQNDSLFGFFSDSLKLFLFRDRGRWCRLQLRERFIFYPGEQYHIFDKQVIDGKLLVLLGDEKYLYYQVYDLHQAVMKNEYILQYPQNKIINAVITSCSDKEVKIFAEDNKSKYFFEKYDLK